MPKKKKEIEAYLGLYMKRIADTPLLTQKQEVELAKLIEEGKEAKKKLAETTPMPTAEEKAKLIKAIEHGNKAVHHFAQANLRLVVPIAKRHIRKSLNHTLLGLIQEGNMGLMNGIYGFDWRLGFKFSTYATPGIEQRILEAIRGDRGMPISLDAEVGTSDDGTSKLNLIGDDKAVSPGVDADKDFLKKSVGEVLSGSLSHKAREAVAMWFGLGDGLAHTEKEIAEVLGVRRGVVHEMINQSLRKLKRHKKLERLH